MIKPIHIAGLAGIYGTLHILARLFFLDFIKDLAQACADQLASLKHGVAQYRKHYNKRNKNKRGKKTSKLVH